MGKHRNPTGKTTASLAVIGMGCRLPGDVDSPAALWRLLAEGREAVGTPPPAREALWARDSEAVAPGRRTPLPPGGYLSDVSSFDADFFGVSGREADVLDPQHRLLLEVAWEALEHAGLPPDRLAGSSTGVFTGLSYNDYMDRLAGQPQELEGSILTNGHCVAAGRISYLLGLHGPAVALDTACSSSLVAFHLACQALLQKECDVALAAGVTLMLRPRTTRSFDRMGMLSPTGRCHTFDAAADGFVRGEGCGAVVLKRLADAVEDGDRILAVVRGSAVNQDGRTDGLAAPSPTAQRALFQQALARAGVDPRNLGMIEAHGTGTPIGDPIEFASLAQVYGTGNGRCALGSVKTNLGHLEPAAGITGLIKTVLCLQHGLIPPNPHFTRWNPAIDAEKTRFFVPTELTRWPVESATRLAAVSSFGFSGTNAHVLLEQAPVSGGRTVVPRPRQASPATSEVLLVPAGSPAVLPASARRLADWLEGEGADVPLRDVAHTLALRRSAGRGRLGVVARTRSDTVDALRAFAAGRAHPAVVSGASSVTVSRQPVWVFSGQGSQWPGMGRGLLEREPAFAAALAEADTLISAEAGFSVLEVVRTGEPVTGCAKVQPVLFALQIALAATWRAHGVEPAGVIGHSMGEVAAAVVAGALSLEDGVRVICRRSALLTRIAGAGAMATVGLDRSAVEAELAASDAESVSVAVLAAPGSTVVAGEPAQVARLVAAWEARGVPALPVAVDVASHSPQVEPLLPELLVALEDLTPRQPKVPFYSTVLSDPHESPAFDAAYWCANLRNPVRFFPAVAAAAADRNVIYVEVSPHPVVTHAVSQSLRDLVDEPVVLPTLRREEDESTTFRTQLAALHCAGVNVDWSPLYAGAGLADVPTIAFDRKRHWVDLAPHAAPEEESTARSATGLPGRHTEVPGERVRHHWRADTGTAALPWLSDHRVHGTPVLPGAAYYAVALTTACQVFEAAATEVEVTDVSFKEMLRLTEHTDLSTTVTMVAPDHALCEIFGRGDDGQWVTHASAVLRRLSTSPRARAASVAALAHRHPITIDPAGLYTNLRGRGLEHGPAFAGITDLHTTQSGDSYWGRLRIPPSARTGEHSLLVHPVVVDLCLQLLVAGAVQDAGQGLVLPVRMRTVRVLGDPATAVYCHARITETTADSAVGHVRLLDEAGKAVMAVDGVEFARRSPEKDDKVDQWFLEAGWHQVSRPRNAERVPAGKWLIIGEGDGDARALAGVLHKAGARAEVWDMPLSDERLEQLSDSVGEYLAPGQDPSHAVVMLCGASAAASDDPTVGGRRRARRVLSIAQAIAHSADPPRLYAVTRGARAVVAGESVDLEQGALRGVVRVLAFEHPGMRATLVDTESGRPGLRHLAEELLTGGSEDEVALRGPTRHIARLDHAPLVPSEQVRATTRTVRYGVDGFRLRAGRLGDLDSLELTATGRRTPGPGEVELRVQAAGVNFRDVLTTMGLLPGEQDVRYRIGFECAGVVTEVGSGVEGLQVGDQVLAIHLEGGAFASFVTVPATAVAPIPAGIDPVTAAGLPTAFLTAWYALRHVGRLSAGERVLIHSASGGTGLAAVAVARLLGAEVLATAGSEKKRQYLRGSGISRVMDSRSLDFAEQTRAATGGEGVDVVLNSLSGAAIRAGLETLRPFGRFVELGVRDILSDAPVGLGPFRHNITMSTVDLIELQRTRPEAFAAMLREVLTEFDEGRLKPLLCTTFPLSEATEAFRLMARAGHTGKLVLTVPDDGETTAVLPDGPPVVHADGSYVVTGGLRGLGLATARWLAEQGAGRIVLNGRTPPSLSAAREIRELSALGTRTTVVLGDIAKAGTAERLVAAATEDGAPLRGVVHCAMVLEDAAITNVRHHQLNRVWAPKVTGAWKLHNATAEHTLDWFVVFSSMASLLGNPGQGVYAAANSWLDTFAAWRTAEGLPTLAVNWGPWGETGVATDFSSRGYRTIPTDKGLLALHALLGHGRVQTGVIPGEPDTWILPSGRQSSFFSLLAPGDEPAGAEPDDSGDIQGRLRALAPGIARRTALEGYLGEHIRAILRLGSTTLDPGTPLKALGFDSLLSTELRVRLESDLGVKLPGNFVWQHPTLSALAAGLADRMGLALEDTGQSAASR
ncbi:type I polyketide synthase [Streptomyces sp. AK02-01A]|uniref:type I polyketide synthase n=1 Tax=Streptomyces sp. AK02-01A TaxID=3028648 RepID=UPI0029A6CA08|nr:type I polyketide synthase [Streptomyces sp. AK02-01A]MDX3853653.1 type I polyketide synthase [Streptomyces sp. AK02-01A]